MDKCFVCSVECNTRRCRSCDVKAHEKCWRGRSDNGGCPSCGARARYQPCGPAGVFCDFNLMQTIELMRTQRVTVGLRTRAVAAEEAKTRPEKERIIEGLFLYLLENRWYLNEYPRFRDAARTRLRYLVEQEGWSEGAPFLNKL